MKKFFDASLSGVLIFLSLSISLLPGQAPSTMPTLLIRYFLIALISSLYSYILIQNRCRYAFFGHLFGVLIAGLLLWYQTLGSQESFSDLGAILLWILVIVVLTIIGLLMEWLFKVIKNRT